MNETSSKTKQEIRKSIRMKKRSLSREFMKEAEDACMERLIQTEWWQQGDTIFTYVSYNHEMGTHLLIKKALAEGKKAAAPRVEGDRINFYYFSSMEELEKNKMGILEPVPSIYKQQDVEYATCKSGRIEADTNQAIDENALFLMPGVAFDLNRNRIGYGGGYYDKYLITHPHKRKIALAYDFQIFKEIRAERHDIRPDIIITEIRTI